MDDSGSDSGVGAACTGGLWTPRLTEEELRDLLSDHLSGKWCCYPALALKSLCLGRVAYTEAFVYTLVSWYETHTVKDRFMPYLGGRVDSRLQGDPPDTWDLKRPLPEAFSEAECALTLPHSEETFACPRCYGVGYAACRRCRRKGNIACHACHGGAGGGIGGGNVGGADAEETSRCLICSGRGSIRCPACRGRAVGVECLECAGSGRLKRYQLVHVAWSLAVDYVVLNSTDLPSHKLTEADGYTVHRQVGPNVQLTACPSIPVSLVMASDFLVGRHQMLASVGQQQRSYSTSTSSSSSTSSTSSSSSTRLLLQRHSVRRIPLCQCDFGWSEAAVAAAAPSSSGGGGHCHRLYVYGLSRRVHLEKGGKALLCGLRAALMDRAPLFSLGGGRSEAASASATATCCLL